MKPETVVPLEPAIGNNFIFVYLFIFKVCAMFIHINYMSMVIVLTFWYSTAFILCNIF